MKKLMVVAPYFYPKIGGMENYAYNISLGLKKKYKWDIVVITSNHLEKKYKEETINGLKIYRLPYWFKISNTPINPLWYFTIKRIIKNEQPDIINTHSPVPFISDIVAIIKGDIPLILTYHSGSMKKGKFYSDFFIYMYEKYILPVIISRSKKIVCVSKFVKESIFMDLSNKTVIITPAVNTTIFKPKIYKDSKKILFIANQKEMYELKGLNYLIKAVKKIPYIKLNIIGERKVSHKSNIRYLGFKNQLELVNEIQRASIIVLPSTIQESFGMVLIEAMACKKPVIGTNIGGIPEVIHNNVDGIVIPPNDVLALTSAIKKIISNKKIAIKYGEMGYKKVKKNFTWDKKVRDMSNLLKLI